MLDEYNVNIFDIRHHKKNTIGVNQLFFKIELFQF